MAETHQAQPPQEPPSIPKKIGDFEIIRSLGKGGMGEVFLAYDRICERQVALKRIRPELSHHKTVRERFLREARFASKLSHPCIIPIYNIYQNEQGLYYTMPYVEGETLKEIFKATIDQEEKGEPPHPIGAFIPALARIFHLVCQALAFSHAKGILHRDIKPENIIVGKFSEVFILDWGIAGYFNDTEMQDEPIALVDDKPDLTQPGKVFGTINYMAPERAMKQPANIQTEIYSLGVILYQILTLKFPFKRKSLQQFRKSMRFETLILPEEISPYRDIPKQLSQIAQKALSSDLKDRYQRVEDIIFDLENYIEGRPEWILEEELNIKAKLDWEFQENILLTKHMALTQVMDEMEWAVLMISKHSYLGNIRIEFNLQLPEEGSGIGILMCIPEPSERHSLEDGYCLWIGGPSSPYSTLFRSNAEVMSVPSSGIESQVQFHVCVEKMENVVRLYIDGSLKLQYISHIPIVGSYIGLIYKDPDFIISTLRIFAGSQQAMVNCLSIPDAFLANKNFARAYSEYKRISYSFHGRIEGREAQFRAGLTLIEQAKRSSSKEEKENLLTTATDEFEMLRATPGAPLEYLGKSLVYHVSHEFDEEIKCLELALRKYPKHPLLSFLKEHIVFRLHESSKQNRYAAYNFTLLALRHLPEIFSSYEHQKLVDQLTKHWNKLSFIDEEINFSDNKSEFLHIAIQVAFWLCKPITLVELLYHAPEELIEKRSLVGNILFCLIKMQCIDLAREKLIEFEHHLLNVASEDANYSFFLLNLTLREGSPIEKLESLFKNLPQEISTKEMRVFESLIEEAMKAHSLDEILPWILKLYAYILKPKDLMTLKVLHLHLLLKNGQIADAETLFKTIPPQELTDPKSEFYLYYGLYLWIYQSVEKGKSHFQLSFDEESPLANFIASYLLNGTFNIKGSSIDDAFIWEKLQIYRYLDLFYTLSDKKKKALEFRKKAQLLLDEHKEIAKVCSIRAS